MSDIDILISNHHIDCLKYMRGVELIRLPLLYNALYDYYSKSGEMPYGIQKARDGDPDVWLSERLDEILHSNMGTR